MTRTNREVYQVSKPWGFERWLGGWSGMRCFLSGHGMSQRVLTKFWKQFTGGSFGRWRPLARVSTCCTYIYIYIYLYLYLFEFIYLYIYDYTFLYVYIAYPNLLEVFLQAPGRAQTCQGHTLLPRPGGLGSVARWGRLRWCRADRA